MGIRTDLALESLAELRASETRLEHLHGFEVHEEESSGIRITRVTIKGKSAADVLGKSMGNYTTIVFDSIPHRETNEFSQLIEIVSHETLEIAKPDSHASALVVGLGNREITPDCIGPFTADRILVTRHLRRHIPTHFSTLREVSAFCPGVLGSTGVESAELVALLCGAIKPKLAIIVDALAASDPAHLCRSIQITDAGISPGSGVQNARPQICSQTLGVPTIAIGVPTVLSATILNSSPEYADMILTAKEIDADAVRLSRILAYSINRALQPDLTLRELDALLT